jgi:hypothetical protein
MPLSPALGLLVLELPVVIAGLSFRAYGNFTGA